jgi:hypothetical protein
MRASVFCTVAAYTLAAATTLMGATLFASSRVQAMPPAGPSGLTSAVHEANALQQVRYTSRRASHDRRSYHTSQPHVRYVRPYANRGSEWDRPYNPYYWGSAVMQE